MKLGANKKVKEAGQDQARLVIAGMDGSQCVNSTTRTAIDLGYSVIVVADASASYGPDERWNGSSKGWPSQEWHDIAMTMLSDGATVTTTKDALGLLEKA